MTESTLDYTVETDAAVIAQLADEAATRDIVTVLDGQLVAFVRRDDQTVEQIDLEEYADQPFRKRGEVGLSDAGSLVTYVNRHSLERATTLWSDVNRGRVIAVLDDHCSHESDESDGLPGWAQHRAVLTLQETPDWKHWTGQDGNWMRQDAFAEHLEDGVDAIRDPAAATMLEVAQSFHATSGAKFASTRHLSGEIQFAYEEQVSARAGQTGTMEIPSTFVLGIAPFEGNLEYEVAARFRFRLIDGALSLGYRLIRADKIRRLAFDDVIAEIATGTDLPVMAGTPRPA